MSNAHTDSYPSKTVETSTHTNVGPVPEQDPTLKSRNVDYNENINRDINKDYNRDVTNLSETGESKGLVSSVVEAAKSAANRVREAFAGEPTAATTTTTTFDDRSKIYSDEHLKRTDDRNLMHTGTTDKPTSEKIKDTAYDAKEKIKDTAYDAKEKIKDTGRDIKDKTKDTAYDIKDKSKDANYDMRDKSKDTNYEMREKAKVTAYDIKDKAKDTSRDIKDKVKDTAYDIKDKSKDTAYDIKDKAKDTNREMQQERNYEAGTFDTHKQRDTSLSADSDIAADSNKQRLRDIKEKVKDAAQAPVEMIQTMFAAGKDRVQEAMSRNDNTATTTKPISEKPGTGDMFSDTYQPGPAQYQTEPSTTEQAKSKLASTTANAADKAENWIAENKHKLSEQADKAQDLAADTKHKASAKAQETGKEPASDTRYYSGVHGQTY